MKMNVSHCAETADPKELLNFEKLSTTWWDKNGEAKPLHSMNKLRIELIRDGLISTGAINKDVDGTKKPFEGLSILDIGCGGGILTEALAQHGCIVTGIDICQDLITLAKDHVKLNSNLENLTYLHESIEEHSIKNFEKYDVVIASEVIDHVNNSFLFLETCLKCLKPGGSIFVTTFNKTWLSWLTAIIFVEYIWGLLPCGTHSWNKFISPDEVAELLERCDCETKLVRGMVYNILTNSWFWSRITSVTYALHAIKK